MKRPRRPQSPLQWPGVTTAAGGDGAGAGRRPPGLQCAAAGVRQAGRHAVPHGAAVATGERRQPAQHGRACRRAAAAGRPAHLAPPHGRGRGRRPAHHPATAATRLETPQRRRRLPVRTPQEQQGSQVRSDGTVGRYGQIRAELEEQ